MSLMNDAARGGRGGRLLLAAYAVLVVLFLILPILVVVPLSASSDAYLRFPPGGWGLRWYQAALSEPRWWRATWNSILIGVPVAAISAVVGTCAALAIARSRAGWTRPTAVLVTAPMMLPHVILAIGLYPIVVDLRLTGTFWAPILGHSVVGIPLVFVAVSAALRNYDFQLELAAMTLGANQWRAFSKVTLPMIAPSAITGAVLAFATSFDELMLSLFLTGPRTETLPRLIWDQLAYALTPTIAAIATLVLALSLFVLALVFVLHRFAAASGQPTSGSQP